MALTFRPRARSAVAAIAALLWGFFFFGLVDLLVRFVPFDDFYDYYLLETGWGVLYFILITVPLLSVAFVPTITSPVSQVTIAGVAVGLAALFTGVGIQLLPAGVLVLIALILTVLGGRRADRPLLPERPHVRLASRIDIPTLVLTVVATAPLIWFSVTMVSSARAGLYPNDDISAGFNHWPMQAALPLAILGGAGLTALHQVGWQVTAWTVTVGTAWMGIFSIAYPNHSGSFGLTGGSAAILWSALLAIVTRRSSHRAQASGEEHQH
jgi:hypothetical protein